MVFAARALNETTAGMIGRREVKLLKDGALLVKPPAAV